MAGSVAMVYFTLRIIPRGLPGHCRLRPAGPFARWLYPFAVGRDRCDTGKLPPQLRPICRGQGHGQAGLLRMTHTISKQREQSDFGRLNVS